MRERRWTLRHPSLGPTALFLLHWAAQALCCISLNPRSVVYRSGGGGGGGQYSYAPDGGGGGGRQVFVNGPASVSQGGARAAPNLPLSPIGAGEQLKSQSSAHALLGNRVGIAEFNSDGYNAQGGGPVSNGPALNCDFEGQPCCWANVPTPSDDQIDWQLVQGKPESGQLRNISIDGRYLVAYASGAAPSDEAQLSSCAIACASSPIRIRARHWQSYNVLLQVCQRESFPPSLGFNPLLNCQEFPSSGPEVAHTELVLPKASYVDIVFVASNFIDERGDIVLLDDIEVLYESEPPECGGTVSSASYGGATKKPSHPAKSKKQPGPRGNGIIGEDGGEEEEEVRRAGASRGAAAGPEISSAGASRGAAIGAGTGAGAASASAIAVDGGNSETAAIGGIDGQTAGQTGQSSVDAGANHGISASGSKAHGVVGKSGASAKSSISETISSIKKSSSSSSSKSSLTKTVKTSSSSSSHSSSSSSASSSSSIAQQRQITASSACKSLKCSFEDATSCAYSDTIEPESAVRGLTTRFEVVKGQFMNRVTGVKEGTEGNYYAAVFLYPREKAGLWANIDKNGATLAEDTRLRFQYYEGTHGVQLKGCCAAPGKDEQHGDELDCPFQSDKFVSVSDRMWKWGTFVCPSGTKKVLFLCENTRTNQGACAMDDIAVVEDKPGGTSMQEKPLC